MLFPITEAYETMRKAQDAEVEENGVQGVSEVVFMRQTIANACGTFALIHALANAGIPLEDDSPLHKLFEDCKGKSPMERARLIEVSGDIERVHESTAMDGQTPVRPSFYFSRIVRTTLMGRITQTPALDADVDLHFVCFVDHQGSLIELDGRRNSPINHGPIKVGLLEVRFSPFPFRRSDSDTTVWRRIQPRS